MSTSGSPRINQRIDEATFRKLKMLSFLSIVLVLFIHSTMLSTSKVGTLAISYDHFSVELTSQFTVLLQVFANLGIGRINRPLFFMVSGCLFFWTLEPQLSGFGAKIRRRFSSLVIPYVLFLLLSFALAVIFCRLPYFKSLIATHGVREFTGSAILKSLFAEPLLYQLWFLRDLIVWIACSPLIWLATSRLGWFMPLLALGYWASPLPLPIPYFEKIGLCFFCVGAWIGWRKPDLREWRIPHATLWLVAWLTLCASFSMAYVYGSPISEGLQKVSILAGICAVWSGYDRMPRHIIEAVQPLVPYSFFIYLTHEPVLTVLKKLIFKIVPLAPISSIAVFLLLPLFMLWWCVFVARHLQRNMPNVYQMLNGGRS